MRLALRPAVERDRDFSETLHRANMGTYLSARGMSWDPQRFLSSWAEFENLVVTADGVDAGVLRLLEVDESLEIRDLQLLPALQGRGAGTWAVDQAKAMACARGIEMLRLRVYVENPAQRLYARLGFKVRRIADGVVHMACRLQVGGHRRGMQRSPRV